MTATPQNIIDEPHIINVLAPHRITVIDTTLTDKDHIQNLLNLRVQLGKQRFFSFIDQVERDALRFEERQKQEQNKRDAESKAQREVRNSPLIRFSRAYKSYHHDPAEYLDFIRNEPTDSIEKLVAELESTPRSYEYLFRHQVQAAVQCLRAVLVQRAVKQTAEKQEKNSILDTLIKLVKRT